MRHNRYIQLINTTPIFKSVFYLICLLLISGIVVANEIIETEDPEKLFVLAVTDYESKKYEDSIKKLQIAVEKEPDVSKYHHILAVSYGREAENVNWFKAMDYAKLTLKHLERANELDPNNLEILDDLMDFYHEAPSFLGGDTKKGDEIAVLIKKLTLESQKSEEK